MPKSKNTGIIKSLKHTKLIAEGSIEVAGHYVWYFVGVLDKEARLTRSYNTYDRTLQKIKELYKHNNEEHVKEGIIQIASNLEKNVDSVTRTIIFADGTQSNVVIQLSKKSSKVIESAKEFHNFVQEGLQEKHTNSSKKFSNSFIEELSKLFSKLEKAVKSFVNEIDKTISFMSPQKAETKKHDVDHHSPKKPNQTPNVEKPQASKARN